MGKMKPNGLSKEERLYLNREVEALFASRQSFMAFPFRVITQVEEAEVGAVKIIISVPKKRLKRATDRNTMKRRTREAYRTNKSAVLDFAEEKGLVIRIGFLYVTDELTPSSKVVSSVQYALGKIVSTIQNQ